MSLSGALSNAASGLAAASRAAQVVSSNVANAMTEGYAARRVEMISVSAGGEGAGVRVSALRREVDLPLLQEHRAAVASRAAAEAPLEAFRALERAFGTAEGEDSLAARLSGFEAALIEAAARPEDDGALARIVEGARGLTAHLAGLAERVQDMRGEADLAIAREAAHLDESLARIAALNEDIRIHQVAGRDAAALLDERQRLVDRIAPLLPVRESIGPNDVLRLSSNAGTTLVDGATHARIAFQSAPLVTADMTAEAGGLSALSLDGRPVAFSPGDAGGRPGPGPLDGGRLSALFELRDTSLPALAQRLDDLAADLVARFSGPAADTSLAPGAPGLFRDPLAETTRPGLAARLSLAPEVDPAEGGALWRLRDGLAAAAPGPAGDATGLHRLKAALTATAPPVNAPPGTPPRTLETLAADLGADFSRARLSAEHRAATATLREETLSDLRAAGGVDTDAELQRLMAIEQAYAANARVLQAIDEMLRLLISGR